MPSKNLYFSSKEQKTGKSVKTYTKSNRWGCRVLLWWWQLWCAVDRLLHVLGASMSQPAWVHIPDLALTICMPLGKLLNLSVTQFPYL